MRLPSKAYGLLIALLLSGCATTPVASSNPQCEAESTNGSLLAGLKWHFRSKDWDPARKSRDWKFMVQTLYNAQEKPLVSLQSMQSMANQVQTTELASDMKGAMMAFGTVFAVQCELHAAGKKTHQLNEVRQALLACPIESSGSKATNCVRSVLVVK